MKFDYTNSILVHFSLKEIMDIIKDVSEFIGNIQTIILLGVGVVILFTRHTGISFFKDISESNPIEVMNIIKNQKFSTLWYTYSKDKLNEELYTQRLAIKKQFTNDVWLIPNIFVDWINPPEQNKFQKLLDYIQINIFNKEQITKEKIQGEINNLKDYKEIYSWLKQAEKQGIKLEWCHKNNKNTLQNPELLKPEELKQYTSKIKEAKIFEFSDN